MHRHRHKHPQYYRRSHSLLSNCSFLFHPELSYRASSPVLMLDLAPYYLTAHHGIEASRTNPRPPWHLPNVRTAHAIRASLLDH
jgi:hypothetical protein